MSLVPKPVSSINGLAGQHMGTVKEGSPDITLSNERDFPIRLRLKPHFEPFHPQRTLFSFAITESTIR